MRRLLISTSALVIAALSAPRSAPADPTCPIAGATFDFCQYALIECPYNLYAVCAGWIPHGSQCSVQSYNCLGPDPLFCPCDPNDQYCLSKGGGEHYTCTYTY